MMKKFESFFDIFKSKPEPEFKPEMRVILDDEDFSDLCDTGEVSVLMFHIPITQEELDLLTDGKVIEKSQDGRKFIIALSDIGYNRIFMHLSHSNHFK